MSDKATVVESMDAKLLADINNRFSYHPPKEGQQARYVALRDSARNFALLICQNSKPSREQSLALTKLQEAVMWANAGIACNE